MKRMWLLLVVLAVLVPGSMVAQEPTISIEPENRCTPYNRDDYSYPQSVERQIIAQMGGRVYSPYTGEVFASHRDTDIEHMVAVSEAHDSGLCSANSATRRTFARDLDNLTLASPSLNRNQKVHKDLGEWLPALNKCWFVLQTIKVKKKYGLSMDQSEAEAALNVLAGCTKFDLEYITVSAPTATSTPMPLATTSTQPNFVVNSGAVNVRSGPGTNYAILGSVSQGQSFTPNGRNHNTTWLRFPYKATNGWVYAPLMKVAGVNSLPVVTPSQPVATPTVKAQPTPTIAPTVAVQPTPTPVKDAQYYKNLCGVGARGYVTIAKAKACGFSMPVCRTNNPGLYAAMSDRDGDGCVGE